MIDPSHPDPYVDEIPHNPGEPVLNPNPSHRSRRPIGRKTRFRLRNSPTVEPSVAPSVGSKAREVR